MAQHHRRALAPCTATRSCGCAEGVVASRRARRPTSGCGGGTQAFRAQDVHRDLERGVGRRHAAVDRALHQRFLDLLERHAAADRGAAVQLELLPARQAHRHAEHEQAPRRVVEPGPAPDVVPRVARDQALELGVELGRAGQRLVDPGVAEHARGGCFRPRSKSSCWDMRWNPSFMAQLRAVQASVRRARLHGRGREVDVEGADPARCASIADLQRSGRRCAALAAPVRAVAAVRRRRLLRQLVEQRVRAPPCRARRAKRMDAASANTRPCSASMLARMRARVDLQPARRIGQRLHRAVRREQQLRPTRRARPASCRGRARAPAASPRAAPPRAAARAAPPRSATIAADRVALVRHRRRAAAAAAARLGQLADLGLRQQRDVAARSCRASRTARRPRSRARPSRRAACARRRRARAGRARSATRRATARRCRRARPSVPTAPPSCSCSAACAASRRRCRRARTSGAIQRDQLEAEAHHLRRLQQRARRASACRGALRASASSAAISALEIASISASARASPAPSPCRSRPGWCCPSARRPAASASCAATAAVSCLTSGIARLPARPRRRRRSLGTSKQLGAARRGDRRGRGGRDRRLRRPAPAPARPRSRASPESARRPPKTCDRLGCREKLEHGATCAARRGSMASSSALGLTALHRLALDQRGADVGERQRGAHSSIASIAVAVQLEHRPRRATRCSAVLVDRVESPRP